MIARSSDSKTALLLFMYAVFFVVAFPSGIFTAAWVYMQATYNVPLDALGVLLIAAMFAGLIVTFFSGRLIERFGMGRYLAAGAAILSLGVLIFAVAPTWIALIIANVVVTVGFNILNVGLNTYISANYSTGQLNWMHAAYPLGGTAASLMVTLIVERGGQSWQLGYGVVFVLMAVVTAVMVIVRGRWHYGDDDTPADAAHPARRVSLREALLLPAVLIGMALFFLTTGASASIINLSKSLLSARAIEGAAYWISFFWGFSFVGRVIVGFAAYRLQNATLLRASMIGMIVGAALLWQPTSEMLNFVGLILFALASSPVYPMLVAESRRRVDSFNHASAIGFQVAAAGLGLSLVPAGVAWLAERTSVDVIGGIPALILIGSLALYQFSLRHQREPAAVSD